MDEPNGTKESPVSVNATREEHEHYTLFVFVCPGCARKETATKQGPLLSSCGKWLDIR